MKMKMLLGYLGAAASLMVMRLWLYTILILSILKVLGILSIDWFAGPFTLGAISTGLWMVILGGLFFLINLLIGLLGFLEIDNKKIKG